jgi:hypothetical protein
MLVPASFSNFDIKAFWLSLVGDSLTAFPNFLAPFLALQN